jgi:hypothetical protein
MLTPRPHVWARQPAEMDKLHETAANANQHRPCAGPRPASNPILAPEQPTWPGDIALDSTRTRGTNQPELEHLRSADSSTHAAATRAESAFRVTLRKRPQQRTVTPRVTLQRPKSGLGHVQYVEPGLHIALWFICRAGCHSGSRFHRSTACSPRCCSTRVSDQGPVFISPSLPNPTHLPAKRLGTGLSSSIIWIAPV